jgi:predicted DNA-binding transcriptional regulator AlpA
MATDVIIPVHGTSIRNFCKQYGFSKSHYYNLRKQGLAPATLHIGARQIVTDEARREWIERMKARDAAKADGAGK